MKGERNISDFIGSQLSCWPLACANFRALKKVQTRTLMAGGLEVTLQHNPERIRSSSAEVDKASIAARKCFLCRPNRFPEQTSVRFEGRKGRIYDILLNPYPIFRDHLVIAAASHTPQSIWKRYVDMLDMARDMPAFTFFYNGPRCGASAPDHMHFQGAGRGQMPLERDIDRLLDSFCHPESAESRHPEAAGEGSASGQTPSAQCAGRSFTSVQDDEHPVILNGRSPEESPLRYVSSVQDAELYHYRRYIPGVFALRARTVKSAAKMFYRLLDCAFATPRGTEPDINLLSWYSGGEWRSIIIFRGQRRSHHFTSTGPDHLTMSPGCVDMAGLFIVPVASDYEKLDERLLGEMLSEVSLPAEAEERILRRLTRTQPEVSVGIMNAPEISFEIFSDGAGLRTARYFEGKIEYGGILFDELFFDGQTLSTMFAEPSFRLSGVVIGKGFHWERKVDRDFAGSLRIIVEDKALTAVNVVGVEDYLRSVVASEMKASAPKEFLKAHAVISRSWLMAQMESRRGRRKICAGPAFRSAPELITWLVCCGFRHRDDGHSCVILNGRSPEESVSGQAPSVQCAGRSFAGAQDDERMGVRDDAGGNVRDDEYICWHDHMEHSLYDVCADDHCQRYQGIPEDGSGLAEEVVDATWGEVLLHGGRLCDTRFSKCCGGRSELFRTCWEDEDKPYLQSLPDTPGHAEDGTPFCAKASPELLERSLNGYDREDEAFFEWEEAFDLAEASARVEERSGHRIGLLTGLEPVETGPSGRILRMTFRGAEGSFTAGKELEIRRLLSPSHLKSSAFTSRISGGRLILRGHGWGHGVGLCQIGAAVMADEGCGYREILEHYYPGSELHKQ